MIYNNDSAAIKRHWQQQIDESLEAGDALVLEGGVSNSVVHNLGPLVALDQLAAERADVTAPWFLIGGDGVAWTMAWLRAVHAPALLPLYGGADQATYLAMLATLPTRPHDSTATAALIGLYSWLLPARQPGVAPSWSAFPFVLAETTVAPDDAQPTQLAAPSLAWLSLVVVIGLIISALFV